MHSLINYQKVNIPLCVLRPRNKNDQHVIKFPSYIHFIPVKVTTISEFQQP